MSVRRKIGVLSESSTKPVEWIIKDFFSYTKANSSFKSSDFYVSNHSWSLVIFPSGHSNTDYEEYVSLYLNNDSCRSNVNFAFGLKTLTGEITKKRVYSCRFDSSVEELGAPAFIKMSMLLNNKEDLVPFNTLTVTCFIQVHNGNPDTVTRLYKLAANLKDMFISQKNTDVSIKVKEETFSAHKFILSARSPVLAAMFENDMTEKKTGIVNIIDFDKESFYMFLLYLYSGELNFSKCDVFALYKIADKYDVPELKLICIDYLSRNLCVNNVFKTYALGHQFDEDKLVTHAQMFFEENFVEIVASDVWMEFLKHECYLANALLKAMAPKINFTHS